MLYTIILTHADGTTATHTHTAKTMKEAHEHGATLCAAETDTLRVYATTTDEHGEILVDELQAGALTVVKRTTANMINREGGDIQYRLYNECRLPHTDDPDTLDCISVATLALLTAINEGLPIDEQYHRAYNELNKHLRASRNINLSVTAMRTVYIEDINGEIISVNGEINRILAPGERYTPEAEEDTTTKHGAQIAAIKAITAALTPTQVSVLRYMAKGYSLRQIADQMKRSAPTIQVHINKIREKAKALYPDGYKSIIA